MSSLMFYVLVTQIPIEYADAVISNVASAVEGTSSNLVYWLIAINIFVTIITGVINFFLQKGLKKQDVINDRKKIISNKAVEVESYIYEAISSLSSFQYSEKHKMLDEIEQLQTYVNKNRLFIRNKLYKAYIDIIDYYSVICINFMRKDPNKERQLLDKYRKVFNE